MNTLTNEQLLSFSQAAKRIPAGRNQRPTHVSTLVRWILAGVKGPNGKVRLEAIRFGGRWLTSVEALERFAAAQTPNLADRPQLPRSPAARQRAIERADARLQKLGI
jgi:hypothetical protein